MSKVKPQRKLEVALTAARPAALGGDLAEGGAGGIELHSTGAAHGTAAPAPVGVIDEVERFGSELETRAFGEREFFEQSQIPILETGQVNHVADVLRQVKGSGGGRSKDRRSVRILGREPLAACAESSNNLGIAVNDPVLAIDAASPVGVLSHTGVVACAGYSAGQSGLELGNAADLPASEGFAREIALPSEEGQVVKIEDLHHVPRIELRGSPKVVRVVGVGDHVALVRADIHALRERIVQAERQAVGEAPVPHQLQRVIAGAGHVIRLSDGPETQIRP